MYTVVIDGEPVVYGKTHDPTPFTHFVQEVTGEWPEQSPAQEKLGELLRANRVCRYREDPLVLNISNRRFQFVAEDCCAEDAVAEGGTYGGYTVPVLKQSRHGTYISHKKINGCRCGRCSSAHNMPPDACAFMNEVDHVNFKV